MEQSSYTQYLYMPTVPAGAVLNHVIKKQHRKKAEVGAIANLIPQRMNDLIKGNRRFTPQTSIALEGALGIDVEGFFYIVQANHDIYIERQSHLEKTTPNLNVLSKTTFWDVDVTKIDWTLAKRWAIQRVLEYGTTNEITELARFYGKGAVTELLGQPQRFRLYEQVVKKLGNYIQFDPDIEKLP